MSFARRFTHVASKVVHNTFAVIGLGTFGLSLYTVNKLDNIRSSLAKGDVTISYPSGQRQTRPLFKIMGEWLDLYKNYHNSRFEVTIKLVPEKVGPADFILCHSLLDVMRHEYCQAMDEEMNGLKLCGEDDHETNHNKIQCIIR